MNPQPHNPSVERQRPPYPSDGDRILAELEALATPAPWVVLTGAPSAGKSTVIRLLERWGFTVRHETAEALRLALLQEQPMNTAPWREAPAEFTKQVLRAKVGFENSAPRDELIFWDRALPDTLPFCERNSVELSAVSKMKMAGRYRSVLLFDPLEFEPSNFRDPDDVHRQNELGEAFARSYDQLGYSLLRVPRMSVEDRARYVLELTGRMI